MAVLAPIQAVDPGRVAVRSEAQAWTYGELVRDVGAAAALLVAKGIAPGMRVGIGAGSLDTGQTYASWVAHLAAMGLGCAVVTLVEAVSVKAVLEAGMIEAAIGSEATLKRVPPTMPQVAFDLAKLDREASQPAFQDDGTRINLTSGTTGTPKFVAWDAALLERRIDQLADAVAGDTLLYPLLHLRTTAGFRYPLAVWRAGGTVLLPDGSDAKARDAASIGACTLLVCSPPQLEARLSAYPGAWEGRDHRQVILLGGRLPPVLRSRALEQACSRLTIGYGATETGSIAAGDGAVIDRHPGAVGFVRPGVEVEIVDAERQPVAAGKAGIIRIRSPLMVDGYSGTATGGESHFDDGWFIPGDIGRLFDDGLLAIEGRATDTFNLGGWKVNALDLENKLRFIPGVNDLAALAMPLDEGDLLTFAIACPEGTDLERVAREIRAQLPRGRPFHVVRVKAIPRNAMGKVPRALIAKRLTALYGASRANLANA